MLKKSFLLIMISLSLITTLLARTYTGGTIATNEVWNPGETIIFTHNTVFTGTVNGTANNIRIVIYPNVNVYFRNNALIGNYSTATNVTNDNSDTNFSTIHFDAGSSGYIINTVIQRAYTGLTIRENNVVVDLVDIVNAGGYGIYLDHAAPLISRSRITLANLTMPNNVASVRINFNSNNNPNPTPRFFGNSFDLGNLGHVRIEAGAGINYATYLEANRWMNNSTQVAPEITKSASAGAGLTWDTTPVLNNTPYTDTNHAINIDTTTGSINNPNFEIFSGDRYTLNVNSNLTIANGAQVNMGANRFITAIPTYIGGANFFPANGSRVTLQSGASFNSRGTATASNYITAPGGSYIKDLWNEFLISNGANARLDYTTVSNAQTGLNIAAGVTAANLQLNNVTINYNSIGINTASNATFSNIYMSGNTTAIQVSAGTPAINNNNNLMNNTTAIRIAGGTPTIQNNRMVNNTTAFNVSGGTLAAGQIQNNRITGATTFVTSSAGTSAAPVYFEQNFWGVATPATANFSGTGTIDYEPWYIDTTLTATRELAPTATAFIPLDGANIAVAPDRLNFNIWEIGYHNGDVTYDLQLADNPNFTNPHEFNDSQRCNTNIFHDISGTLPAGDPFWVPNTEYFWRIRTKSPADTIVMPPWSDSIPSASFILQGPQVDLVLTSDRTFASAGEKVLYTVDFTNNSDPSLGALALVKIVNVLPDDVFFDGRLELSSINSSMTSVTMYFYSDVAAGTTLNSRVFNPTSTISSIIYDNTSGSYTDPLPAAQNRNVRRIDVVIGTLPDSAAGGDQHHGIVRYRTVVK